MTTSRSWSSLLLALTFAATLLSSPAAVQATPLQISPFDSHGSLEARANDAASMNSSDPFAAYRNPKYTQEYLDSLWALVESKTPVVQANITEVVPRPSQDSIYVPPDPADPNVVLGLPDAYQWPPQGSGCNKDAGLKFPDSFRWGVATAAFQVEGAAKDDGKAPSNWDMCGHYFPGCIANNQTGDVTDNHYYQYKEDLARLKKMGGKIYSFSISWSRIYPFGNGPVNEAGLKHYDEVIDEALAQGLDPVATLHHWDTPLSLEFEYGSFRSARIVDDYVRYADTVLRRYGDRVKTWVTFNEPNQICGEYQSSYPYNVTYNGELNGSQSLFHCAKNLLLANSKVHRLYHELIDNGTLPEGEMAFKNDNSISLPHRTGNSEDIRAAKRHDAVFLGLWSDPVYSTGDWPEILTNTIPADVLPRLNESEKQIIKGAADFYAIDLYSIRVARATRAPGGLTACESNATHPDFSSCTSSSNADSQTISSNVTGSAVWPIGELADPRAPWLYNSAGLVRNFLRQIRDTWSGDQKIYLSEVGFAEPFEDKKSTLSAIALDSARTRYVVDQLEEYLLAIHEDGLNLAGVFFWSLLDNLEWNNGLDLRFGLQYVNYTTHALDRHYKQSFLRIRDFFKAHS
ncbi:related to beta-glucosidase [Sporisorium reilianum SRZ2]|uniref:Related to beta-glucosidase n=1 Tax=Sporisorium reilianum (strain SRZ2) TaxID=999809 RepID=E7A3C8_SPORE|nr:related to beta-glucosidase [Sporisorium reilianum SRZ2]